MEDFLIPLVIQGVFKYLLLISIEIVKQKSLQQTQITSSKCIKYWILPLRKQYAKKASRCWTLMCFIMLTLNTTRGLVASPGPTYIGTSFEQVFRLLHSQTFSVISKLRRKKKVWFKSKIWSCNTILVFFLWLVKSC